MNLPVNKTPLMLDCGECEFRCRFKFILNPGLKEPKLTVKCLRGKEFKASARLHVLGNRDGALELLILPRGNV